MYGKEDTTPTCMGTCQDMCPVSEFQARQRQKRLGVFETQSSTYKNLPVKEFSRSAAGKKIVLSELRPAKTLLRTMDYLINDIVDRSDHPWTVVYHFVFDRIRAIRQDMVIQRIEDESAVMILEKTVRFLIFAHYKLCNCSVEWFDPYINDTHIQECLKRLLVLYDNGVSSPNRAEFEGFYLLHNIDSSEAMERILNLQDVLRQDVRLKLSLDLCLSNLRGNFVAVFRISRKLSFLSCCLIQKHSLRLRSRAVAIMNTAFSNPNCKFPLYVFSEILAFGDWCQAKQFVSAFGIEVTDDYIKFAKKCYQEPAKSPMVGDCEFVNMTGTIKEILNANTQARKSSNVDAVDIVEIPDNVDFNKKTKVNVVVHGRERGVRLCSEDQIHTKVGRGRGRGRGRKTTNS